MEREELLPCPQDPIAGPYPKPGESVPHQQLYFIETYANIILPSIPKYMKWSSVFQLKFCMHLYSLRCEPWPSSFVHSKDTSI
jgi:hypothetical protein